jgi:metal-responsive CopG/Arc/MetJ family transcriptional regulator
VIRGEVIMDGHDIENARVRMEPVSMLLPPTLLAALDEAAAREQRTRSNMARVLLQDALKNSQTDSPMAVGGQ